AGIAAAAYAATADFVPLPESPADAVVAQLEAIRSRSSGERVAELRAAMQQTMDMNAQVFRSRESLTQALADVRALQARYADIHVQDKSRQFNLDLLEAVELGFLLDLAEVVVEGALAREESRGGHFREDFPDRDDEQFMVHTMAYRHSERITLDYNPVVVTRYEPMERKY